jgi:hypothetical protein
VGQGNPADLQTLRALRSELLGSAAPQAPGPPWRAGYATARRVREHLNLDSQPLPSLGAISDALGTTLLELNDAIRQTAAVTPLFDALLGVNEKGSPGFVISSRREEAKRFHLCRGLFEFLTSPCLEPALLTRAGSYRQARNRAFAAEFLAPAAGLRERLSGKIAGIDEVAELAAEFSVPPFVIAHQLENHGIAFRPGL